MKHKLIAPLVFVVLAAAAVVPAANAAELKIGVVDLGRLVTSSPQAKRARANMQSKFSSRKDELQGKAETLKTDVNRLKRDGQVMSDAAREKLEGQIRDQQRRLKLLQDEYNDDVQQAEKKEMGNLRKDVREVIDSFAKSKGYDLIVGDGILYASDKVDVTDEVLKRLKDKN